MSTINYNIPGNGNFVSLIFKHTDELITFLDNYKHIDRLRNISQLGRLRDIYQGAHHNRYEYVFLQWTLISEIAKQKGNNYGFSSNREFFGKINSITRNPSSAEIIQCLILLNNIGYCDGTFSTNRAWLHIIKSNRKIYNFFKVGLLREDIIILEKVTSDFDYYNLNIVFALFLLQRYKRTDNGHVDFSTKLLRAYYWKDSSNVHLTKIWDVYSNIRKIAFLSLDSMYAPVPFSLNLTSIVLSFNQYYEEIFIKKSPYKSALDELEKVLQNSVYLSSDSILNTNKSTEEVVNFIESKIEDIKSISTLYSFINCESEIENKWKNHNKPDWDSTQIITINFDNAKGYIPKDIIEDNYKWEKIFRIKIGITKIRIGALTNIEKSSLRVALSLLEENTENRLRTTLKSSFELVKVIKSFPFEYRNSNYIENYNNIFTSILKSIFGWDKRFILQSHDERYSPFIIENGKKRTLVSIDKYIEKVRSNLNADQICELNETRNCVEKYNHSGLIMVFIGATKIFNANNNSESAEFDGLIIFPTMDIRSNFFYIIESKNYSTGFIDAQKQLQKRIRTITPEIFKYEIEKLSSKSAIGKFKLK
jgi:hypothetical protein